MCSTTPRCEKTFSTRTWFLNCRMPMVDSMCTMIWFWKKFENLASRPPTQAKYMRIIWQWHSNRARSGSRRTIQCPPPQDNARRPSQATRPPLLSHSHPPFKEYVIGEEINAPCNRFPLRSICKSSIFQLFPSKN